MVEREDPGNEFGISLTAWNFLVVLAKQMLFPKILGKNL